MPWLSVESAAKISSRLGKGKIPDIISGTAGEVTDIALFDSEACELTVSPSEAVFFGVASISVTGSAKPMSA